MTLSALCHPHAERQAVEHDAVALYEVAQRASVGQMAWRAHAQLAALHQPDGVGQLEGQLQFVGRHKDGLLHLPCQLPDAHLADTLTDYPGVIFLFSALLCPKN